jgi:Anti-sigma-K factor rskA, C-terminal/Putative zinc-finger
VTHADVRELIASYTLGALEPNEIALVQEHLEECAFCANLAREASEVAHYMPYAAPYRAAPAGCLERLLTSMGLLSTPGADTALTTRRDPVLSPPAVGPRRGLWQRLVDWVQGPVLAPAAAGVVLILGLASWNMTLMRDLQDERREVNGLQNRLAQQTHLLGMVASGTAVTHALQGTAMAPSADVRLVMDMETNSAMLVASRLPPLPSDRIYQVWLGRQGARMPAARLVVDRQGDGECNLDLDASVRSYDSAWITLEPAMGGPMPNSPGIAKATL